jgi:hypothetical protein
MRIDRINLSGSLSISSSLAVTPLRVNDNYLFISSTGNVGIGTSSPTKKLVVTGSVAVRGGLRATTLSGSFTGSIKLPNIPLGTSETNIVLVNGGGGLVYRSNLSLTGAQGNQGPQGNQGIQGTEGTNGNQGNQGPTGIQGTAGTNGNQGNQGPQGNQGIQGIQGTVGTQGFQGRQGPQGNQGPTGVQGTVGTQGFQGRQGPSGSTGPPGPPGAAGIVPGVNKILFGEYATPGYLSGDAVTFPTAFSTTPTVFAVAFTGASSAVNVVITGVSTTSFSYAMTSFGISIYWIAIN